MLEDYVIDLEKVEDMLDGLRRCWEKLDLGVRLGDFEILKEQVTNLGGAILLFDEEVRKLSLPHFALKLRKEDEK